MKPQFYKDMGITEYHAQTEYLSKSMLKEFADCPARFKYQYLDGGKGKESKSLRMGNAVHTLALEPELWKAGYHILPNTYFNDKGEEKAFKNDIRMQVVQDEYQAAGWVVEKCPKTKAWMAKESAGSKVIISKSEYETIERMANALAKDTYAVSLLKTPGYVESSIFFDMEVEDPETGEVVKVPMRCRPDKTGNDGLLVDLKIARSVKPGLYYNDAFNYLYHLSVAVSFAGYEALHGKPPEEYAFVCVESEQPHIVECFGSTKPMDELTGLSYLDYGRIHLNHLLQQYVVCKRTGVWPSYQRGIGNMEIPQWALRRFVDKGEF